MSRLVRIQLALFLALTMVGVSVAGVRYAGLGDEWFTDRYRVQADFADSGGIFVGAEVTYRGVTVGEVEQLRPTRDGVTVTMLLDAEPKIPADATATVANRSALGEQYVDLVPQRDSGPYLSSSSGQQPPVIPRKRTEIPLSTNQLIYDLNKLVDSVPKRDLKTVVDELGAAFEGTGRDLSRIVESGNELIETADAHSEETIGLLENSATVLETQRESEGSIRSFSKDLADLSEALTDADADLRTVLDSGVKTGRQLNGLVQENEDDISTLLTNLTTGGKIVRARLDGVQHILIVYPYVVRGGYSVVDKNPETGNYTAHFGLQVSAGPRSCREGYEGTKRRQPERTSDGETNTEAHCSDEETNLRGAQHRPAPDEEQPEPGEGDGSGDGDDGGGGDDGGDGSDRPQPGDTREGTDGTGPGMSAPSGAAGGSAAPLVAPYDPATGVVEFPDGTSLELGSTGGQYEAFGEDSWKWLLLGPLAE